MGSQIAPFWLGCLFMDGRFRTTYGNSPSPASGPLPGTVLGAAPMGSKGSEVNTRTPPSLQISACKFQTSENFLPPSSSH